MTEFPFLASRAPYIYDGPAAALIKKLKYEGCLDLVPILSNLLYDFWKEKGAQYLQEDRKGHGPEYIYKEILDYCV